MRFGMFSLLLLASTALAVDPGPEWVQVSWTDVSGHQSANGLYQGNAPDVNGRRTRYTLTWATAWTIRWVNGKWYLYNLENIHGSNRLSTAIEPYGSYQMYYATPAPGRTQWEADVTKMADVPPDQASLDKAYWDAKENGAGLVWVEYNGEFSEVLSPEEGRRWPDAEYEWVPLPVGDPMYPGYFKAKPKPSGGTTPDTSVDVQPVGPSTQPQSPLWSDVQNNNADMDGVVAGLGQVRDAVLQSGADGANAVGTNLARLGTSLGDGLWSLRHGLREVTNAIAQAGKASGSTNALSVTNTVQMTGTVTIAGSVTGVVAGGTVTGLVFGTGSTTGVTVMASNTVSQIGAVTNQASLVMSAMPTVWSALVGMPQVSFASDGDWTIPVEFGSVSGSIDLDLTKYASMLSVLRTLIKWGMWATTIMLCIKIIRAAIA